MSGEVLQAWVCPRSSHRAWSWPFTKVRNSAGAPGRRLSRSGSTAFASAPWYLMRVPSRATGAPGDAWEVASQRPERTRARATRSSPAARTLGEETAIRGPYRRASTQRRWPTPVSGRSAAALLPDPLLQHDRGADEAELLAQPAFDVALVRRLQLAAGEEHEHRRLGRGLGAE